MAEHDGKVAVVSGAARGQGRSHALALAREGAAIVGFDICAKLPTVPADGATEDDLRETGRLVEEAGGRFLQAKVDARDLGALEELADRAMDEFGRVDILVVNHGVWSVAESSWQLEEEEWNEVVDTLLSGSWKVAKAFIPKILEGERGGSIVITSSTNGIMPQPGGAHYSAAKAGQIHLAKVLAWELGKHEVRVNAVCPGGIDTPMLTTGGGLEKGSEWWPEFFQARNRLPVELLAPEVISDAVLWLVSDRAKFVTGVALPVDSGWTIF
jgi:(+)-trans-carveol dehydrogenase